MLFWRREMKNFFRGFLCTFVVGVVASVMTGCDNGSGEKATYAYSAHVTVRGGSDGFYLNIKVPEWKRCNAFITFAENSNLSGNEYWGIEPFVRVESEEEGKEISFMYPYVFGPYERRSKYRINIYALEDATDSQLDEISRNAAYMVDNNTYSEELFIDPVGGAGQIIGECVLTYSGNSLNVKIPPFWDCPPYPDNTMITSWTFGFSPRGGWSGSNNPFVGTGNGISWTLTSSELTTLKQKYNEASATKTQFYCAARIPLREFNGSSFKRDMNYSCLETHPGPHNSISF